eukprot:11162422-Alexandrium_andersonii.AAC.1
MQFRDCPKPHGTISGTLGQFLVPSGTECVRILSGSCGLRPTVPEHAQKCFKSPESARNCTNASEIAPC